MINTHNYKISSGQTGLTLIELMVAMLIGIILLMGITSMFMANKRIYKEQENMSRVQENARFAIELMMKDIRMAGYAGCVDDINEVQNNLDDGDGDDDTWDDDNIFDFSNTIEGYESGQAGWSPSGSTELIATNDILANTDAITLRYLDPTNISVDKRMPSTSANIDVTSIDGLEEGDIIGLTDCDSADIFQITGFPPGGIKVTGNTGDSDPPPGNDSQNLLKPYDTDASVIRLVSNRYFIKDNADGIPTLHRMEVNGDVIELIEGVQQMQIVYGVTTDTDRLADVYRTADQIDPDSDPTTDTTNIWDNVVSVRLSLLLRTIEENNQIGTDTQNFNLLGGNSGLGISVAPAGDFHRRRIFTTTIQIRNRST